jgi:phosphoribosylamine--glycine ligase
MAWKLQSPKVQAVYVAPGNGGTAMDAVAKRQQLDARQLLAWNAGNRIDGGEPRTAFGRWHRGHLRAHGLRVLADEGRCSVIELKAFRRPS